MFKKFWNRLFSIEDKNQKLKSPVSQTLGDLIRQQMEEDESLDWDEENDADRNYLLNQMSEYMPDKKVIAVKVVRRETGWDLKQARKFVDDNAWHFAPTEDES